MYNFFFSSFFFRRPFFFKINKTDLIDAAPWQSFPPPSRGSVHFNNLIIVIPNYTIRYYNTFHDFLFFMIIFFFFWRIIGTVIITSIYTHFITVYIIMLLSFLPSHGPYHQAERHLKYRRQVLQQNFRGRVGSEARRYGKASARSTDTNKLVLARIILFT